MKRFFQSSHLFLFSFLFLFLSSISFALDETFLEWKTCLSDYRKRMQGKDKNWKVGEEIATRKIEEEFEEGSKCFCWTESQIFSPHDSGKRKFLTRLKRRIFHIF